MLARCRTRKWRFKVVVWKLTCSTATNAALIWVIKVSTSDSQSLDTARLFLAWSLRTSSNSKCDSERTNKIKIPRSLWIPPVLAWNKVEKQNKDEQQRHFSSVYFCIPWGILAIVKLGRLSAFSSGGPRGTHEGNKSHSTMCGCFENCVLVVALRVKTNWVFTLHS